MTVQRLILRSVLLVGATVVVAAGCQGHSTTAGSLSATAPATGAAGSSGGTSTSAAQTTPPTKDGSAATTPPACTAASLTLALGPGAGAAAGSRYPALQFTNVGNTACVLTGFPGVSYVAGDDGHQVGAPAVRTGPAGGPVTLAHGQTGSAVVQEANTQNFPPDDCRPVPVRGFRVYPPNDTTAMFVPFGSADTTACSSTSMPGGQQLFVHSVAAGSGE
jgi:hypothetical protein